MRWGSLTDFSKVRATNVQIARALNQKVTTIQMSLQSFVKAGF